MVIKMTVLAYACCVILSVLQSSLVKMGGRGKNPELFNINKATAAALMFLIVGLVKGFFPIHAPTLLFGLMYGTFFSVSMWAGLMALSSGPLALTSTIISFSLIIPCTYGILFCDEKFTLIMAMGFVLLASSFILINYKKGNKKGSLKWLLFTVCTLISDGCCAVTKKMHQAKFPNMYKEEIMFVALSTVSVVFIVIYLIKYAQGKHPKGEKLLNLKGIVCGLANGGSSYFSLYLVAVENVSVQAPVLAALTATTSLAVGRIIFKEKLTALQTVGFILGVASIVLLKL